MKTSILKSVVLLLITFSVISCSKNDDTPITPVVPTSSNGFKYSENGATTKISLPNPFVNGSFNTIIAQNASNETIFEINLTSVAVGTYAIDNTNNYLTYVKSGVGNFIGSAGTVVITANANNKLTGTFNATAGSGATGVNSVSGSFTNIVIN